MALHRSEMAEFRTVGDQVQKYRFWRPRGYSRSAVLMLLPEGVEAIGRATGPTEWIFTPEIENEAPVQVRDLASLVHRLEFRYDLHLEDLTLFAAGRHALPALTWVAITQPELRAMVLVDPEFEFEDAPSQEIVRRLVEAAPLLETPTQVLLSEERAENPGKSLENFFANLGCEEKLLTRLPRSQGNGIDPEVALRKVSEFTRSLHLGAQAEVA